MTSRDRSTPGASSAPGGTAWVIEGQFGWKPPESEGGRYPVLLIGQHVLAVVNGELRTGRYQVQPGDVIEINAEVREPVSEIGVEVTKDNLEAYVYASLQPGQRFRLKDTAPSPVVSLQAELEEELPPEPVTQERVNSSLQSAGVVFGIDENAVREFAKDPDTRRRVARGEAPVEPRDAQIERLFKEVELASYDPDALQVDLLDRQRIAWVQPNTLLARRIPPQPGQPGKDVYGNVLTPRMPKDAKLQGGQGTILSEDGNELRAEVAGRPVVVGRLIKVLSLYVHEGNADVTFGHIRFEGDVQIRGQVCDNINIAAGGSLEVQGSVCNAVVEANLDTQLHDLVIGSQVKVGGKVAETVAVLPFVNEVSERLARLVKALQQLEASGAVQSSRKKGIPYGLLVKRLLETRFGDLMKLLPQVSEKLRPLEDLAGVDTDVGTALVEMLAGLSPLKLQSAEPVIKVAQDWRVLEEELTGYTTDPHNLLVKGLENSQIWVSGEVYITGFGSYNSVIQAGKNITCPQGVLRGGQALTREGVIEFKEIGSKAGVPTVASTGREGRIEARLVHPGVILSVGGIRQVIREPGRNLKASINIERELTIEMEPADPV